MTSISSVPLSLITDEQTVIAPSPPPTSSSSARRSRFVFAPRSSSSEQSSSKPTLLQRIEGLVSRGVVALFGRSEPVVLARIATGMADLDDVLGGGLPRGRLVEIAGPPTSGKTRLALQLCASVQQQGGVAAYVDAEHGLDRLMLQRAGVRLDELVIARPDGGEAALHVVDELLRHKAADVIVVDSVAALVPKAELVGRTGDAPAGHHARLMSQAVRRLTLQAARAGAVVVFVNQLRRNWGEDGRGFDVTTGGNALLYAAATRLFVSCTDHDHLRVAVKKARFGEEGRIVRVAWPTSSSPSTSSTSSSSSSSSAEPTDG